MSASVIHKDELEHDGTTREFQGYRYGDTNLSFIWVDLPPGGGPRLHKHPYEEVFIILVGQATFTVGSESLEATAGQILIAPRDTPHKFVNSGAGPLRQIDIHASKRFITEWLED